MFNSDDPRVVELKFSDVDKMDWSKHQRVLLGRQRGIDNSRRVSITVSRELAKIIVDGIHAQLEAGEWPTVTFTSDFGGMEIVEDV